MSERLDDSWLRRSHARITRFGVASGGHPSAQAATPNGGYLKSICQKCW